MSTITTIQSTDVVADSRTDINTNFENLNTDKVETLSDLGVTASAAELNYVDGVTSAIQTQIDGKASAITGEIKMVAFGEGSIPSGFLICDGAAVNRTTYADLFTSIGTTFGVGDGSTTFNVPDLRGRVPAGIDSMGQGAANTITDSNADALGGEFGSETHTLTEAEMPSHTHTLTSKTSASGAETGILDTNMDSSSSGSGIQSTTDSTGSGSAHNNVQPTIFLNFVIKT